MRLALTALIFCVSSAALAEPIPDLPMFYDVTGVEATDVLNIRTSPDPGSEIVGTLAPDQSNVEVIALSEGRGWGQINADEQAGWVSMRYMQESDAPFWWELRRPLSCFGTEPFWSATINGDTSGGIALDVAGEELLEMNFDWLHTAWGNTAWGQQVTALLNFAGNDTRAAAVVQAQSCNDGMSDFEYGIAIHVVVSQGNDDDRFASQSWSGCCSMTSP